MLYGTLHDSYSFWYITKEKKKIFGIHKWIMSDIVYLCEPFTIYLASHFFCPVGADIFAIALYYEEKKDLQQPFGSQGLIFYLDNLWGQFVWPVTKLANFS